MTIKQLSIFLENKTGRINDLTKILSKHGINMHAFSMAETTDFGILRLIVSDVERAVEVLRDENFAVIQGKCQNTGKNYLIKFAKHTKPMQLEINGIKIDYDQIPVSMFKLIGAYPINGEEYQSLSENGGSENDLVACLYEAYPEDRTKAEDWAKCVDKMMVEI